MTYAHHARRAVCALLLVTVGGCVTTRTGTQVDKDRVSQIYKGRTTRVEVERMFGPPLSTMPSGNGQKVMTYSGSQSQGNYGQAFIRAIPIVGALVPTKETQTRRNQSLVVTLDSRDVVQDVQFADSTTETQTTMSMFGGHVEQRTTPNPSSP